MVKNTKFGVLYIVATPIGNLQDISKRALNTLNNVDLCAAEDTRKSKVLLNKYNLEKKLISYHKFSEKKKLDLLISFLKEGKDLALISDSGTPLISDPGYLLVKRALEEQITVSPIPGPSSLISALSVSGFATDAFVFYGFAPRQIKAKELFIKSLIVDKKTSIVFESKKRIIPFLEKLSELSPDRNIFIAREMTKLHETFYKGKANHVLEELILNEEQIKGEFVLIIEGNREANNELFLSNEQEAVLKILMEKMNRKEALSLASKSFGISKNLIYKLLLKEN
tara:strand:+ start:2378 stop:3226 length:849 start_codon:yes stop_codon:yes gene_type:complete